MTEPRHAWDPLGSESPGLLVRDRLLLHHGVQILASFCQALLEARPDDGHRSMIWVDDDRAFRTEATRDGLHAVLRVPHFMLELRRGDAAVDVLGLSRRTVAEGRTWLGAAVGEVRSTPEVELESPEYEIPEHPAGGDAPLEPDPKALLELSRWYHNAHLVLGPLASGVPEASPVRCWPHHFDMATLMTFPAADDAEDPRYVGVGLSPGDDGYAFPYLYVNGWPAPRAADLPELAPPGHWHTDGWVGAVLKAEEVTGIPHSDGQAAVLTDFVARSVAAMRKVMLG
jgi:hypothetical protein